MRYLEHVLDTMTRTPKDAPLDCYAVEHDPLSPICRVCPHRVGCVKDSGVRNGRVALNNITFDLVPAALKKFNELSSDQIFQQEYDLCYAQVFGEPSPSSVNTFKYDLKLLRHRVKKLGTDLHTYIAVAMATFSNSNPDRNFYPGYLFSESCSYGVSLWKRHCAKSYGYFSDKALSGVLFKEDVSNARDTLLSSEITAGGWIVGYKVRQGGSAYESLFAAKEEVLHPLWLAIDPTYGALILAPHVDDPDSGDCSKLRKIVRSKVLRIQAKLNRGKRLKARYLFKLREAVLPLAIKTVLGYHGLDPRDLETSVTQCSDPLRMWVRIGMAIQHWHCYRYVEGDHRVKSHLAAPAQNLFLSKQ